MKKFKFLAVVLVLALVVVGFAPAGDVYAAKKTVVKNQKQLMAALAKGEKNIVINSNKKISLSIPAGDYKDVTFSVKSAKADIAVAAGAIVKGISIDSKDAKVDLKIRGSVGSIDAPKAGAKLNLNVMPEATVTQIAVSGKGADIAAKVDGVVTDLVVAKKADIAISGNSAEPINVVVDNKNANIETDVPVNAFFNVAAALKVSDKAAEASTVNAADEKIAAKVAKSVEGVDASAIEIAEYIPSDPIPQGVPDEAPAEEKKEEEQKPAQQQTSGGGSGGNYDPDPSPTAPYELSYTYTVRSNGGNHQGFTAVYTLGGKSWNLTRSNGNTFRLDAINFGTSDRTASFSTNFGLFGTIIYNVNTESIRVISAPGWSVKDGSGNTVVTPNTEVSMSTLTSAGSLVYENGGSSTTLSSGGISFIASFFNASKTVSSADELFTKLEGTLMSGFATTLAGYIVSKVTNMSDGSTTR